MAKFVKVETQGFSELKAVFTHLPDDVESKVLAASVSAGMKIIEDAALAAAPRHTGRQSTDSKEYGTLVSNIKIKLLRKRYKNKRSAILTRGGAFWGDILNRGSRYISATRWYETAFDSSIELALETQKQYMVAKIIQLSNSAIARYGANKK